MATIKPLSSQTAAATGYTHVVTVTADDLTETATNTAQTISLMSVVAGQQVTKAAFNVVTAFEDASDTAFNHTRITVGDGNDVDRYIPALQINDNASDKVTYQAGSGVVNLVSFPVTLANITGSGDVVTAYTPGFRFAIEGMDFVTGTPVTTGSKAATLNAEIGTTNITAGTVALTSAACTPLGAIVAGAAVTGLNVGTATDTFSIESSSVTAFAEGTGVLVVKLRNLDAQGPSYTYTASDTIDLVVNSMSGKALNDIDTGELQVYLAVSPALGDI